MDDFIVEIKHICPFCDYHDHVQVELSWDEICSRCGHYSTCDACSMQDCSFRDDLYNTDGDCLAMK